MDVFLRMETHKLFSSVVPMFMILFLCVEKARYELLVVPYRFQRIQKRYSTGQIGYDNGNWCALTKISK